ncbi:hypothetical protein Slin15195_G074850 [Septoria linicola]|uniref:Rhodopsin domain-containing protein n=1 Tax=Septoria linicola TaxID=215465 RepID=A0A9Q9EJV6_9PEZI|nr:hypothetical protein Slin15195_G074850 [Septoria linicola]
MSAPELPTLPDMNSGPRNFITTDQDHGGIALTICTLMATWVVLCFGVRVYMRATVSGPFGLDDIICSVATIFGVLQMVVSSAAISFGFGKALVLLSESQIVKASKAVYAAQLLYIITNTLTKCTVALLLARIVFVKSRVYACYGVLILSCVWGLASFLAEAIRCTEYPPWKIVGDQCYNLLLSWQVITAFNVIIEALLFALPVWLVWNLQTAIARKIVVVAVFALRLPVIVVAILRVHFLSQMIGSDDPLLNGVVPFICLNIEMHWGLIAATIPTLKPFVGAFNTGWGTYDTQGISGYGHGSGGSYVLQSLGRKSNRSGRSGGRGSTAQAGTQNSATDRDTLDIGPAWGKTVTHVKSDRLSAGSDDSKRLIIRQTQTCEVHVETGDDDRVDDLPASRGQDSIEQAQRDPLSLSR